MASSQSSPTNDEEAENRSKKNCEASCEWLLAKEGVNLFINNKHSEAEDLFLQYPDSLIMYSGYSFAVFMDALMSFEDEKLTKAILILKEVERRCTAQSGWIKSISIKVFGTGQEVSQTLVEQLEAQIILADSQVCLAILTFLQQDLSGYFKGGWVLRKAWKVYQRTYKEILTLYNEKIGELLLPDPITTPESINSSWDGTNTENLNDESNSDWDIPEYQQNGYPSSSSSSSINNIPHSRSLNFQSSNLAEPALNTINNNNNNTKKLKNRPANLSIKKSLSVIESLNKKRKSCTERSARFSISTISHAFSFSNLTSSLRDILPGQQNSNFESQPIDKKSIKRLMGAVSFGYGLFQLGVSLLPPSLTKLINLFGFTANRQNGVACLMYARLGVDMRAPLASLALLWYHTIVRPFYAIDGVNVQAGVEAANILIEESKSEFADSALFLFFAGRTCRLHSDTSQALINFQKAIDNANHREIKMLCLHESGWCHLIELDYSNARITFIYLKQASRWSRVFYAYLAAVCTGSLLDYSNYSIFDELTNVGKSKAKQLDEFLTRRFQLCPSDSEMAKKISSDYYKLLIFEMLYLWNAMASCKRDKIQEIIDVCSKIPADDEPNIGLSNLLLGSCYNVLNNGKEAEKCFRKVLKDRNSHPECVNDIHILAFAEYELGNILIQNDLTVEEGKFHLQQVIRYSRYDFEARLNVKVHSMLRQFE